MGAEPRELLAATSKASPDRPEVMRRLAESYAALARSADAAGAAAAHRKELQHYNAISAEYPQYAHGDEAYYYAGLAHEQLGDLQNSPSKPTEKC